GDGNESDGREKQLPPMQPATNLDAPRHHMCQYVAAVQHREMADIPLHDRVEWIREDLSRRAEAAHNEVCGKVTHDSHDERRALAVVELRVESADFVVVVRDRVRGNERVRKPVRVEVTQIVHGWLYSHPLGERLGEPEYGKMGEIRSGTKGGQHRTAGHGEHG